MSADLEDEVRRAMRTATADLRAEPDLAVTVRARFRRGRRRRLTGLAAALVVAAVAIPAALMATGGGGGPAELRVAGIPPTAPVSGRTPVVRADSAAGPGVTAPPSTAAGSGSGATSAGRADRDVDGVDVTWLPPALLAGDPNPLVGADGPITVSPYQRATSVHRLRVSTIMGGRAGFLDVDVQRGRVPSLDAVRSLLRAAQPARTFARTTIRGHEALVVRLVARDEFGLVWAESQDLLLAVTGGSPVTEEDLRTVAAGLRVHAPPRIDPATDQAIRAVVVRAFQAHATPADLTAAVENGGTVAEVPQQIANSYPGLVDTARVTVHDVALTGAATATAVFTITFEEPRLAAFVYSTPRRTGTGGASQNQDTSVTLVRTDQGWRVTRAGYCQITGQVGGSC